MQTTPDSFRCAEHDQDLTELVHEELEPQIPATFRPKKPKEFRVIVTCPGAGTEHPVAFTGTVTS
jgi:hypothetical protein